MTIVLQITCVIGFVWAIAWLSAKTAKQNARIEELEKRAKARKRANEILDSINNLSLDDVHKRLHNIDDN